MASIESSHIKLTLRCSECGYTWDIKNYNEVDVYEARMDAENEPCPECEEDE